VLGPIHYRRTLVYGMMLLAAVIVSKVTFDHFRSGLSGTGNPNRVSKNTNKAPAAVLTNPRTLTIQIDSAAQKSGNSVTVVPSQNEYEAGTSVTLTPVLAENGGWFFDRWENGLTGNANPATLTITDNMTVKAVFSRNVRVGVFVKGPGMVWNEDAGQAFVTSYCRPQSTLHLRAVPEINATFVQWQHGITGTNVTATITLGSAQEPTNIIARFVSQPGVDTMDFVGDLSYTLSAFGITTPVSTFDNNKCVSVRENLQDVYGGNGIPDAAELYLVQAVLQQPALDYSRRNGVTYDLVWKAWQVNLARARKDLSGVDIRVVRTVAAYMTLGDYDSITGIAALVNSAMPGIQLDLSRYSTDNREYFGYEADANRDGVRNIDAWSTASPNGSLVNLNAYAVAALGSSPPAGGKK
jgi:hypothetical protein